MPQEIEHARDLSPGDVVMVARKMCDKKTNRKFTWRLFVIVAETRPWTIKGIRIGAEEEREEISISFHDEANVVHYLDPDEWPDGVHAFRMRAILEGKIEGVL